jgi:hypothetical protein
MFMHSATSPTSTTPSQQPAPWERSPTWCCRPGSTPRGRSGKTWSPGSRDARHGTLMHALHVRRGEERGDALDVCVLAFSRCAMSLFVSCISCSWDSESLSVRPWSPREPMTQALASRAVVPPPSFIPSLITHTHIYNYKTVRGRRPLPSRW